MSPHRGEGTMDAGLRTLGQIHARLPSEFARKQPNYGSRVTRTRSTLCCADESFATAIETTT
jgi:hypothetical protein